MDSMKYMAFFNHRGEMSGLRDVSEWSQEQINTKLKHLNEVDTKAAVVSSLPEAKKKMEEVKEERW